MRTSFYRLPYILLLLPQSIFAQSVDPHDALKNELAYLSAEKVTIGSRIPQTKDNTPAILTIVSEKEILNSGARDLIDVLRLVPGFDFGVDIANTVGPSIRGNWAYEGGILILVDGLEMNERRYGTVQLGQHYPIDNIEKIEIMRGPGSIIYGGFARLAVINIITKGAKHKPDVQKKEKDQDELAMTTRYGLTENTYGHRGLSFYGAKNLTDDMRISATGKVSQAHRADRVYMDALGRSIDLASTNTLEDMLFNIGFSYKDNLTMRFILDDYSTPQQDAGVGIRNTPVITSFKSYQFDTKYHYDFNEALKLSFNFNYSYQVPWQVENIIGTAYVATSKISSTRYIGGVRLDYDLNDKIHISNGLDFSHEEFEKLTNRDILTPQVLPIYENITPYIESLIKTDWGNLTLGLRYDKHNTFESNLAPRVALTDKIGNFHYKLLYSNSFRTPTVGNTLLAASHNLKPERTNAYEMELGYQFNDNLSLTTNTFYLSTRDKLVFGIVGGANSAGIQYNANSRIATAGVETELRWKQEWGYITFNHSYSQMLSNINTYQPVNKLTGQLANSDLPLAFPAHKFTLNSHYQITDSLSVNPSFILTTSRYGYDSYQNNDPRKNLLLQRYKPQILGNVYFRYQDAVFKGLDLGVGVYNLFNVNQRIIQPYDGGHAPLPGQSREVTFKVSYQF